MLETLEAAAQQDQNCDPMFVVWLDIARAASWRGSWDAQGLEHRLLSARKAVANTQVLGTEFARCVATSQLATISGTLGFFDEAVENFTLCLTLAGPTSLHEHATIYFAWYKLRQSFTEEARELLTPLNSSSEVDVVELRRIVLAEIHVRKERCEAAVAEVLPCREGSSGMIRRWAGSVLGRAFLAMGDLTAASSALERAFAESPLHSSPDREAALSLTDAELQHALGNRDGARAVLREARERILETAAGFQNDDVRSAFMTLESIARVLALAQEWLDPDDARAS